MMKILQRLGRSLLLPVATLPVAGILMGIGYWIDPTGWGANNVLSLLLLKAGGILIDNMSYLFAIGVAVGMSDEENGTSALSGLIAFLAITTMLGAGVVGGLGVKEADMLPFNKINNQFIGILSGLIAAFCYNKFKNTQVPEFLGFFGGKHSVPIMTTFITLILCVPLFYVWPIIFNALISFSEAMVKLGALGAAVFGFINRLLIPIGLHHAANAVFFFDVAGINDLGKFWSPDFATQGIGTIGQYMSGFFPVMMFGLPGAALAMYRQAKPSKRKVIGGIMLAAALCSFFTGVTEPLEFSFMFLAPVLYFAHAVLAGVFVGVTALLPARAGFNFSAGFVDFILSLKNPHAMGWWILIILGIIAFVVYYFVFTALIKAFDLKTPGREDDQEDEKKIDLSVSNYTDLAASLLEAVGGKENISRAEHCVTRLRLEVNDRLKVDEAAIKSTGVAGVIRPGKNSVQIIIGPKVQFVYDEFKKLLNK